MSDIHAVLLIDGRFVEVPDEGRIVEPLIKRITAWRANEQAKADHMDETAKRLREDGR
tara:strand:+ start:3567 stop:3740 length:174 start_codon:yes stop_codon:yes gene_type:complete